MLLVLMTLYALATSAQYQNAVCIFPVANHPDETITLEAGNATQRRHIRYFCYNDINAPKVHLFNLS